MQNAVCMDHVVIAASDLQQGVQYIQKKLGVGIPFGGVHESMGTHNHLMRLGDSVFLEVIAINPDGQAPAQPRWYGLDDPYVRASIAREPALVGWVANTRSIDNALASAKAEGRDFGNAVVVSRGDLSWKFGLPEDGRLLAAGMLPYLIEWGTDNHPATLMADTGCTLLSLSVEHHRVDWLRDSLQSIGATGLVTLVEGDTPRLSATIDTPAGRVTLQSPAV